MKRLTLSINKMDCSTYLPTYFTSWFDFYKQAKPHVEEGQEYLYVQSPHQEDTFFSTEKNQKYKYSIQYIKNQVLEELYELRELQTFSFEELHLIRSSLEVSERYSLESGDGRLQSIQKKIGQQIINIRRNKIQGL